MIRKYLEGMELNVGMFVNCEGLMRNTLAGKPRKIVGISDKSIETVVCGREDEGSERKLKRLIQFVCDTQEESNELFIESIDAMKKGFIMEQECKEQIAKMMGETSDRIIKKYSGIAK